MNSRNKAVILTIITTVAACGKSTKSEHSELSWKTYDPIQYPSLLVNKVDSGEIAVYVVGEENLLLDHIAEAISMWTAHLPTGSIRTRFVESLSDADLTVEVVAPFSGRRQFTTLMPHNRPVITLFDNHNKKVLLHEMGHAFGMNDTYVAYHDGRTGHLTSTCDIVENQPQSLMCLGGNGQYKLYYDDILGMRNLYDNRKKG